MKKAMIAMSGGVDSSVAAWLMKRDGYDCMGVTMRLFAGEDSCERKGHTCCSLMSFLIYKIARLKAFAGVSFNKPCIISVRYKADILTIMLARIDQSLFFRYLLYDRTAQRAGTSPA